jgi:hypothetical protein
MAFLTRSSDEEARRRRQAQEEYARDLQSQINSRSGAKLEGEGGRTGGGGPVAGRRRRLVDDPPPYQPPANAVSADRAPRRPTELFPASGPEAAAPAVGGYGRKRECVCRDAACARCMLGAGPGGWALRGY